MSEKCVDGQSREPLLESPWSDSCPLNLMTGVSMAKPRPRWLKLDQLSKVHVKVGAKSVEFRIIVPADRIRWQLKDLEPGK